MQSFRPMCETVSNTLFFLGKWHALVVIIHDQSDELSLRCVFIACQGNKPHTEVSLEMKHVRMAMISRSQHAHHHAPVRERSNNKQEKALLKIDAFKTFYHNGMKESCASTSQVSGAFRQ
jgi:hypothetical protein